MQCGIKLICYCCEKRLAVANMVLSNELIATATLMLNKLWLFHYNNNIQAWFITNALDSHLFDVFIHCSAATGNHINALK